MLFLSQQDKRWAETKLGSTQITVGRYGCTITSISMALSYAEKFYPNCFKTPAELAKSLGFTKEGYLLWATLKHNTVFKLEKRLYSYDISSIKISLQDPRRVVLLNVNNGAHWVLALGVNVLGGIIVADPWTGKKTTTRSFRNITGSAHLIIQ